MKPLDISAINLNAPYSVWNIADYYYFRTKLGAIYKIGFMDDDTIWESGAYQFIIVNENNTSSPNDSKLRETIFCIIEDFFKANPEILLYLCETGDGKQASRNRLFVRWFREYAKKSLYYFDTVAINAEGIENFAAIIVQKKNPKLNEILEVFNHVVNTLKTSLNNPSTINIFSFKYSHIFQIKISLHHKPQA